MATNVRRTRSRRNPVRARPAARSALLERAWNWPRTWPRAAWWAIGVTALYLLLDIIWAERDHSVPISDAGFHLEVTIEVFKDLQAGDWARAVEPHLQYPPLAYLVEAFGAIVAGLSIHSMVISEDLFFVTLLALGCYQIGRLAFSPQAGLLAVVFALGAPLFARLMHLTMLDAPQAATVAAAVWLILATRYFTRLGYCAAAGAMVGLAMLTKESAALFIFGVGAVTLLRGGWRGWRGLLVFAVALFVVAGPWYLHDYGQVKGIGKGVVTAATTPHSGIAPPRFSSENLQWYLWSFLDLQVYLPLFLFATVGAVWMVVGFVRRRMVSPLAPELFVGAFTAWFALTETFFHDNRYGTSMLVFFAVFGSYWIVRLPRAGRIAATALLVLIAAVNTLGDNFGWGGASTVGEPSVFASGATPNEAVLYSNGQYLVAAAPEEGSDMPGVLQALVQRGVIGIVMLPTSAPAQAAFLEGMAPLTIIANLQLGEAPNVAALPENVAVFDREWLKNNKVPPCVKLPDETGVWIRLGNPYAKGAKDFCPTHNPQFYTH